ncbi:flagellar motor protein MotA [Aristophania vespae]|uniref:flagellar motor protein MotA n=1 Tax=Aristophania vespae TaxID=2697033 RepID=UPI0023519DCA|nr:flagellar motor protein MotA [Aristophania vespae]UMM63504.1 hypothetical protein DM15PD_04780 [Aristophania vespae]
MTRPTRYLVRMVLFLLIIAGLGFYLSPMLKHAFMANPGLNGTILGILVLGIIWNFHLIIRLYPEINWADGLRQKRSGLTVRPKTRLLGVLSGAIKQTQSEQVPLTLSPQRTETLLDSLSARMDEGRDISRYTTQLLIFLGLLGTFYGLLLTLRSIADVIGGLPSVNADVGLMFDHVKNGLVRPLTGMATAFSGSMFGLAGALILGFLDLTTGQAQNRFFNELEDWLTNLVNTKSESSSVTTSAAINALTSQNEPEAFTATMEDWLPRVQDFMRLTTENVSLLQQNLTILRALVRDGQEGQQQVIATLKEILNNLEQQGREQASIQLLQEIERQLKSLRDEIRENRIAAKEL